MDGKKIWRGFCSWTSVHGFAYLSTAKLCDLILWALILALCSACCVVHLISLVSLYFERNSATKVEIIYDTLTFPAITLCGQNPYLKTDAHNLPLLNEFMHTYATEMNAKVDRSTPTIKTAMKNKAKEKMAFIYSPEELITNLTRSAEDNFIEECSFAGKQCEDSDFRFFVDAEYGFCLTFNSLEPLKTVSRAGPQFGVRFALHYDVRKYFDLAETNGIRVAIHNTRQFPFPGSYFTNIPSGVAVKIALNMKRIETLSAPFSNCLEDEDESRKFFEYHGIYSVEGCYRNCKQRKIIEICDCADPRYGPSFDANFCNLTQAECVIDFLNTNLNSFCHARCPERCTDTIYAESVSYARWLTGESGLSVEIYFERSSYLFQKNEAVIKFYDVLSDIGGTVGLWIGFSAIGMIEILMCVCSVPNIKRRHM